MTELLISCSKDTESTNLVRNRQRQTTTEPRTSPLQSCTAPQGAETCVYPFFPPVCVCRCIYITIFRIMNIYRPTHNFRLLIWIFAATLPQITPPGRVRCNSPYRHWPRSTASRATGRGARRPTSQAVGGEGVTAQKRRKTWTYPEKVNGCLDLFRMYMLKKDHFPCGKHFKLAVDPPCSSGAWRQTPASLCWKKVAVLLTCRNLLDKTVGKFWHN